MEALLQRCPVLVPPAATASRGQTPAPPLPPQPPEPRPLMALQRLAPLLQLQRATASEEVRLALQQCLAAALELIADAAAAKGAGADQRLLVFSGGDALPLAGYLVHCCLEAAEAEVAAGHKGTRSVEQNGASHVPAPAPMPVLSMIDLPAKPVVDH